MKYIDYHRNILIDKMELKQHPMIEKALSMLDTLDMAITTVIRNGDWVNYVNLITDYDKFLWECNHHYPQKTNPINILQNKKYSSYRETLLLPLWIRIKNKLPFHTELLLNNPVVQTIYSDKTYTYKDVDGGLGVLYNKKIFPIIVDEDKSGHFCKTTAKNVNGIMECFKKMNTNIITMSTTDNKVTIGKKIDAEDLPSLDIIASVREKNGYNSEYQSLNAKIFEELETKIVSKVLERGEESFMFEKYLITKKQNKLIRESIDDNGLYINF